MLRLSKRKKKYISSKHTLSTHPETMNNNVISNAVLCQASSNSSNLASSIHKESMQGTILTRTVSVNITGSLANLAMAGPQGGIWKPVEGKQTKVFGGSATCANNSNGNPGDPNNNNMIDSQLATNQLRTALIHEVNVLEHNSTFPVAMGVKINCIPAQEITDLGQAYAYTVLPMSRLATSHNIYKCDVSAEEGHNWRNEYPKWNANNLETEGVLEVANCSYVFVNQEHPIIALLRSNSSLIGCNIDDQPKIDNEWFKVTRQVLAACCNTLRSKVLSKVASNDLNTFQIQLERLNADSWDDINDVTVPMQSFVINPTWTADEMATAKKLHVQQFLSTPFSYMARIQLKYEIQSPS